MLSARASRVPRVSTRPSAPARHETFRPPNVSTSSSSRALRRVAPVRAFASNATPEVNVTKGSKSTKETSHKERAPTTVHPRSSSTSVWGPALGFEDFDTMFNNMDRFANRMLRPFGLMAPEFRELLASETAPSERSAQRWRPAVDIQEDKEKYTVHAELPGVRKEDVKIDLDDGVLTLRGERKMETKEEDKNHRYTRVERQYGSFVRRFPLPKDVDQANIKATFKDGILEVKLPRSEKSKGAEILIE